jgi:outer membrane immunogenic protein
MRRWSATLIPAVAVVAFVQIASAADMPVKAPTYTAPVAVAPSWTGFYVGGSVGGRWADPDWTTTCLYTPFSSGNCPLNGFDPNRLATRNPASFETSGAVRGGVYGGFNWQFNPTWVAGVEVDYGWANNKSSVNNGIPGTLQAVFADQDVAEVKQTWDAGVRGRLGYLINPNLMLFATVGASWTHLQATTTCAPLSASWCSIGGDGLSASASTTKVGWTVGGGLEWMFAPNWLLRGEYRYADYGTFKANILADPAGSEGILADIDVRTHTALFGVAYKFGAPLH